MKDAMEMVGAIGAFKSEAESAAREFPAGFAIKGIVSLLLRELLHFAIRKGPPPGLADDLKVTDVQAQKIRGFVLKRELARED